MSDRNQVAKTLAAAVQGLAPDLATEILIFGTAWQRNPEELLKVALSLPEGSIPATLAWGQSRAFHLRLGIDSGPSYRPYALISNLIYTWLDLQPPDRQLKIHELLTPATNEFFAQLLVCATLEDQRRRGNEEVESIGVESAVGLLETLANGWGSEVDRELVWFVLEVVREEMTAEPSKRLKECAVCIKFTDLRCSGCQVHFCCVEHQRLLWPTHKFVCKDGTFSQPRLSSAEQVMLFKLAFDKNLEAQTEREEDILQNCTPTVKESVRWLSCLRAENPLAYFRLLNKVHTDAVTGARRAKLLSRFDAGPSYRPFGLIARTISSYLTSSHPSPTHLHSRFPQLSSAANAFMLQLLVVVTLEDQDRRGAVDLTPLRKVAFVRLKWVAKDLEGTEDEDLVKHIVGQLVV
ncbi:zinc finger, MYND-type domain containing protein [Pseudohyphozyma bogoriensis]|nr:zinc finger, MYND-type domain containing protein [Pseudohyphozyma bogoriensis]